MIIKSQSQDHPIVTIVMPVQNEAGSITRSLSAVLAQDYPAELLEIFVADGISTDGTRQLLNDFKEQFPGLLVLDNPQKIVPCGLNLALRQARGKIIVRVDGHTIIASDYVRECVRALQTTQAQNVGGRMNAIGHGKFGEAVAIATSSPFGVGGARFHYSTDTEWVDTVYMGAWPRQVFGQIGLFDEELVRDQDDEFNYRLREAGGKILLCPQIKSTYHVRSRPAALWRQYYQYGFWKVRVLQKHPRQMRSRHFVPPTFVASLAGSALLGLVWQPARWLLPLILAFYLAANLFASGYTAWRRGWKHLPLLPLVYAILHLSYGLGFLAGLVRFANRWGDKTGKAPPLQGGSEAGSYVRLR